MESCQITEKQKSVLKLTAWIAGVLFVILLIFGVLIPAALKQYFKLDFQEWIVSYSEENDLDPFLVCSVIFCESGFDPNAVSRAGARGLMQVMPGTGQEIAELLHESFDQDQLFDPETSIRYGTFYLGLQMQRFDMNPAAVLAAYNAGPHRAEQWIAEYGFDSRNHIAYIPFKETDKYVDKVLMIREVYEVLYRNMFTDAGTRR